MGILIKKSADYLESLKALRRHPVIQSPVVKLLVSIILLSVVIYRIDWQTVRPLIRHISSWWLLPVFILFNFSQVLSAMRLKSFIDRLFHPVSLARHIALYYEGMLYNLVVPSGFGGDVYKLFKFRQWGNVRSVKVVRALLMDRLSGLVALIVILLFLWGMLFPPVYRMLVFVAAATVYAIWLGAWRYVIGNLHNFLPVNLLAAGVQLAQVVCVYFIVYAMGYQSHAQVYLIIFLLSSLATVIPVTVGGLGMREMVFLFATSYFGVPTSTGLAVSLTFFMVTAVSSCGGIFVRFRLPLTWKKNKLDLKKGIN